METFRLIDIGNTTASFYDNGRVYHQKIEEFKNRFETQKFYYISVNKKLKNIKNGINLEEFLEIETKYKGLGVDRKISIKAIKNGIIVDAGSAITVDIVKNSKHKGGFILPGVYSYIKTFRDISKVLKLKLIKDFDINKTPQDTNSALNYAVYNSIILPIKKIQHNKKIYFTGGDGELISKYFNNSEYDKNLIFKAMIKTIKKRDSNRSTSKVTKYNNCHKI